MTPRKLWVVNFLMERFLWWRTWGLKRKIRRVSGVKTLFLSSKHSLSPITVFYVHGGAYVLKLTPKHLNFLKHLANQLPFQFVVPLFKVIPKITIEELNLQVQKVLEHTFKSLTPNTTLILMGDSAGGGSISWLYPHLEFLHSIPEVKLCLISPFVRAFFTPEEITHGAQDPVIRPKDLEAWQRFINTDTKNPQLNPLLLHSLKVNLTEIFLWYGGKELLFQQIAELQTKMIKENALLTTIFQPTGYHVQPLFSQREFKVFVSKFKEWLKLQDS